MPLKRHLLFLFAGCLPAIPSVSLPSTTTPIASADIKICRMVHLHGKQPLLAALTSAWSGEWDFVYTTIVLESAAGTFVMDSAISDQITQDVQDAPLSFVLTLGRDAAAAKGLGSLLHGKHVDAQLLTHAHWDHAGGFRDVNAPVRIARAEWSFVNGLSGYFEHGVMPHHFVGVELEPFDFDGPAYDSFPSSHEIAPGIVAVPLPGHTPGGTGFFVNTPGKRYLFVGDASWVSEGITRPEHKAWFISNEVDSDKSVLSQTLGHLHAYAAAHPEVVMVIAHDDRTQATIPECL